MGAREQVHPIVENYKKNLALALGTMDSKEGAAGLAAVMTVIDILREGQVTGIGIGNTASKSSEGESRYMGYSRKYNTAKKLADEEKESGGDEANSLLLKVFKPWDNDEREVIEEVEKLGCKSLDEIKGWSTLRPVDDLCRLFRLHINSRAAILPRDWNDAKNFILARIMSRNGLPYRCFSE